MNLVEENKLSLNDKVIKYVPEFKGNQEKFYEQKSNTKIIDLLEQSFLRKKKMGK